MAFLKYRTFDGADDHVASDFGGIGSVSCDTFTVAVCLRLTSDNGIAGAMLMGQGDNPFFLMYDGAGGNNACLWDGSTFVSDGPAMSPAHGLVIVVFAKNNAAPAEWSYYRFDTDTWSHTTSGTTLTGVGSWPDFDDVDHYIRIGRSLHADMVCAGVWSMDKLSTVNRELLADSFAAWTALAPDELWRMDLADPADTTRGFCQQTIWAGSILGALNGDSLLLEAPEGGGGEGTLFIGEDAVDAIYVGDDAVDAVYVGEDLVWSAT